MVLNYTKECTCKSTYSSKPGFTKCVQSIIHSQLILIYTVVLTSIAWPNFVNAVIRIAVEISIISFIQYWLFIQNCNYVYFVATASAGLFDHSMMPTNLNTDNYNYALIALRISTIYEDLG